MENNVNRSQEMGPWVLINVGGYKLMLAAGQRTKRLRVLIKHLKTGRTVTVRDLRAVLTVDELAAYDAAWQSAKEFADDLRKTPENLEVYLMLLRSADALTQRANTMRDNFDPNQEMHAL